MKLTRFTIAAVLAAFLLPAVFAQVSVGIPAQKDNSSTAVSGTVLRIENASGVLLPTFAEKITGAPSTVSIVIQGCMTGDVQGDNCTTLETNTATTGRQIRHPSTASTVYDYFLVTPSWTGGTSTTVTINSTLSPNARNGGGLGSTTAGDIAALFSGCSGIQYLGFDGACHSAAGGTAWGGITGTLSSQTDLQNALNLLAPIASPTFTGTVGGITKSMVGLGSVDNTADTAKPVSTAQQTALDLKSPLASPTFTGTVNFQGGASVSSGGTVQAGSSSGLAFLSRSKFFSPADGVMQVTNAAGTGINRFDLGLATSSGPAFCVSGTAITTCLGDGTAGGTFGAGVINLLGATSGTATITPPAIAGTSTNPIAISNVLSIADGATATPAYAFTSQVGMGMWRVGASQLGFNVAASNNQFGLDASGPRMGNGSFFQAQNSAGAFGGTVDTGFYRSSAKTWRATSGAAANSAGSWEASSFRVGGTKFASNAGCTESATVGGATAGKFTVGVNTACTIVITMGDTDTAANGWSCWADDQTAVPAIAIRQTASTTTTASLLMTVAINDVVTFGCVGY